MRASAAAYDDIRAAAFGQRAPYNRGLFFAAHPSLDVATGFLTLYNAALGHLLLLGDADTPAPQEVRDSLDVGRSLRDLLVAAVERGAGLLPMWFPRPAPAPQSAPVAPPPPGAGAAAGGGGAAGCEAACVAAFFHAAHHDFPVRAHLRAAMDCAPTATSNTFAAAVAARVSKGARTAVILSSLQAGAGMNAPPEEKLLRAAEGVSVPGSIFAMALCAATPGRRATGGVGRNGAARESASGPPTCARGGARCRGSR